MMGADQLEAICSRHQRVATSSDPTRHWCQWVEMEKMKRYEKVRCREGRAYEGEKSTMLQSITKQQLVKIQQIKER
jgi:hypothetical protein